MMTTCPQVTHLSVQHMACYIDMLNCLFFLLSVGMFDLLVDMFVVYVLISMKDLENLNLGQL